ncbi:MAG: NUDIX domain-containing protein [Patescibacteria group bacterium]
MADTGVENKDTYYVAVKVFLEREGKLFIFKDKFGMWDLPGGRIKKDEFETPLPDIIARKMREEVGSGVQYDVEPQPSILMRHERVEVASGSPRVRIFGLGFRARMTGGEIQLSGSHTESLWVDPRNFKPEDYFTGGWLAGVKEYLESL